MALTKTGGDGQAYPVSAWLYVPDRTKPSTWKIRYKEMVNGQLKVTKSILGMAMAALTKGFRGNVAAIPSGVKQRLVSRVKALQNNLEKNPPKEQKQAREAAVIEESTQIYDTFEEMALSPGNVSIDRDKGVLKSLPMLGLKSKNGRIYLSKAVESAVQRGVYEGRPCYKDHGDGKPRRIDDILGHWKGVRFDTETNKVRGDLHTLERHRPMILDLYDNGPTLAAPSHVVEGKVKRTKQDDGSYVDVVEHIASALSVDLVAGAATVNSMKESKETIPMTEEKKDMTQESYNAENNDDLREQLNEVLKEVKELRKENAEQKSRLEEAEKLAATHDQLEKALNESELPEPARKIVMEQAKGLVLNEEQIKTLIESQINFIKACGTELGKPTPKVPTDSGQSDKKMTFAEAVARKTGTFQENKEK